LIGTVKLRSLGVVDDDLDPLVEVAMVDPCIATNPKLPMPREVKAIYARAL